MFHSNIQILFCRSFRTRIMILIIDFTINKLFWSQHFFENYYTCPETSTEKFLMFYFKT